MDNNIIEWRKVYGYENYAISQNGDVKSLKTGRILKALKGGDYLTVRLSKNGNATTTSIHRLVAFHFIPFVEGKDFVNHKDLDKHNNKSDNLEWCTRQENIDHYNDSLDKPEKEPKKPRKNKKRRNINLDNDTHQKGVNQAKKKSKKKKKYVSLSKHIEELIEDFEQEKRKKQ